MPSQGFGDSEPVTEAPAQGFIKTGPVEPPSHSALSKYDESGAHHPDFQPPHHIPAIVQHPETDFDASANSPVEEIGGLAVGTNPETPDLRVRDEVRARAIAEEVDREADEAPKKWPGHLEPDTMSTVISSADRAYQTEKFDRRGEFTKPIEEELERNNIVALTQFGRSIAEDQRKHGETVTLNQELFEVIADFVDKYGISGSVNVCSDKLQYLVKNHRDSITLVRYSEGDDGSDDKNTNGTIIKEKWEAYPYQEGLDESAKRPGASAGAYYTYEESRDERDDDNFNVVKTEIEKTRYGITRSELDELKKALEEFEPTPEYKAYIEQRRAAEHSVEETSSVGSQS